MNLFDILACPRCDARPRLVLEDESLRCPQCGSRYPITNGIPRLIAEAAKTAKEIHEEE